MTIDFIHGVTKGDIIYDIETFPNAFTCTAIHAVTNQKWVFEISDRRDDLALFKHWLTTLRDFDCSMVGYNNLGFDYPVIHHIYNMPFITVADIYNKAMSIINTPFNARFSHIIYESDTMVNQIDLFKVHHYDNVSKATSLKILEFNMRMKRVEDLPFDVGKTLCDSETGALLTYNLHDVVATLEFYNRSSNALKLRRDLSDKFDRNMINMSDVKMGETLLILEMEKHGIQCYERVGGRKQKKQTIHSSLALSTVIMPYVRFDNPEFKRVHRWLNAQTIVETKGVFKDLVASVNGLDYKLGTGGLHASVDGKIIQSSDTHQLIDVDVASFYPNLAIVNRFYPAHLGEQFCDAYLNMYHTRQTFAKGTPENEAYKLALNGAYGGSNNKYSPFYDMAYTMKTTINGQLLLCMLVEHMLKVPGLTMVQCNTDGITYLCPREYIDHTRDVCKWWEGLTGLQLEEALYSRMFVRDVNNYIAEYESGKLKRIGAYAHVTAEDNPGTRELPYHKDWSARVVPLAAEAALVRGEDIRSFIEGHDDDYDFMLRTKVPRSASLVLGEDTVPNIIRYYISTDGQFLEKVMPAAGEQGEYKRANKLTDEYFNSVMAEIGKGVWDERVHTKSKTTYEERRNAVHSGWTVMMCNTLPDYKLHDIDYEYYIREAEKLVHCMTT